MLVAPWDHVISDAAHFQAAVAHGVKAASDGRFVTFGITPNRVETGYGHLELARATDDDTATDLRRFVEKPDKASAEASLWLEPMSGTPASSCFLQRRSSRHSKNTRPS